MDSEAEPRPPCKMKDIARLGSGARRRIATTVSVRWQAAAGAATTPRGAPDRTGATPGGPPQS